MQSRYYEIERWWDRSTRNWVTMVKFKGTGNLSSVPAVYVYRKDQAKRTGMAYFQRDLAQELRELRGGLSDPRGGRFSQPKHTQESLNTLKIKRHLTKKHRADSDALLLKLTGLKRK